MFFIFYSGFMYIVMYLFARRDIFIYFRYFIAFDVTGLVAFYNLLMAK